MSERSDPQSQAGARPGLEGGVAPSREGSPLFRSRPGRRWLYWGVAGIAVALYVLARLIPS